MKAYKGFTQALQCRGFQFESGKEYIAERVKCCEAGFHACEHPLDVFQYYSPADSRFCEVELGGELDQESQDDTKVAATRIRIGAELSLHSMIDAAIKFTFDRATLSKKNHAKKDRGAASATGESGAASATGESGAASATGERGAASATGYKGAASATGYKGAASATGACGAASATGYKGAASATGYKGAASATGPKSIACALGCQAMAKAAIGNWIVVAERDYYDNILSVQTALVDGETIKVDTYYRLAGGKFAEVMDEEQRR